MTEKRTRGAPCSFKCKQGLQGRKRQGRQIDGEKDKRCALQFQVQAGAPGKKTSGRQIDGEKDEKGAMQFQVQAGAPGKKNRGAKLTEKRTRDAPCSFKCKQGLHGRKCQGRQIDGEKENKSLNCQTYFPFGLKIRNVVFLNSIIMMLVSLRFSCIPLRLGSAVLEVIGKKARDTVLTNGKGSKYYVPSSPLPKIPPSIQSVPRQWEKTLKIIILQIFIRQGGMQTLPPKSYTFNLYFIQKDVKLSISSSPNAKFS